MYQYILFDLDGTLTDPGMGITNSVAYALSKYGIEVEDRSTLYPFIGPPLYESFGKYYGFSYETSLEAVEYYREYFRDRGIFENEPYEGIREALSALKDAGRTLILATSKPEEFAVRILEHFGLAEYFDYACGATMGPERNRKGDVISYALELAGVKDKSSVLMVGDRENDVVGASENGILCAGVLYGYGSREELEKAGATYLIERVEDLPEILTYEN